MPPIQGIDHMAINVRDLGRSLEFYTGILGLKITAREPSKPGIEYFLDCGPSLIGLIQGKSADGERPLGDKGIGGNHLSFRIPARDFDTMIPYLESSGVVVDFAKKREKSWSLYFFDPDGNKLEITAWPVEDGLPAEFLKKGIYHAHTKNWQYSA